MENGLISSHNPGFSQVYCEPGVLGEFQNFSGVSKMLFNSPRDWTAELVQLRRALCTPGQAPTLFVAMLGLCISAGTFGGGEN